MNIFLTIDVGTTSIKIVAFDTEFNIQEIIIKEYKLLTPKPSIVELHSEIYWNSTKKGISEIIRKLSGKNIGKINVSAISLCSQGETIILLDKEGKEVRHSINWLDNRSVAESKAIDDHFGVDKVYEVTGQQEIVPTWPATKLLWLKNNENANYNKIYKVLLTKDFIVYKLTGKFESELSVSSSTLYCDINAKCWWGEMINYIGYNTDQFPVLREPGEIVDTINAKTARELGINSNCLIINGAFDQASSMLGSGNITSGILTETTGAVLAIGATIESQTRDPKKRIACYYHAIPDKYYFLPWESTAGMALKWFRDEFCYLEKMLARKSRKDVYEVMDEEISDVPAGSEGLIFLPYLCGACTPEFNANAKAVFYGIQLGHSRRHFIRAVMESVGYKIRDNLSVLKELNIGFGEIRSLGGGSKSKVWRQIKSDINNLKILKLKSAESTSFGAAMMAAKALGIYSSYEYISKNYIRIDEIVEPQKENIEIYNNSYNLFLKVYKNLLGTFEINI